MRCGVLGCDGCVSWVAPVWGVCVQGDEVCCIGLMGVSRRWHLCWPVVCRVMKCVVLGSDCVSHGWHLFGAVCSQGDELQCICGVMGVSRRWHLCGAVCA